MADDYARSPDEQMRLEIQSLKWHVDEAEAENAELRRQVRKLKNHPSVEQRSPAP